MCGIAGVFNSNGIKKFYSQFVTANKIAGHRGPDGEGVALFAMNGEEPAVSLHGIPRDCPLKSASLALGHRRLAIIDLSPAGLQPMSNEDGSLWIVYNGEIYNYLELKADLSKEDHTFHSGSDTEVILHAYESWGQECVSRFNGMWAFVIADLRRKVLFCSRDRFGIKPFFYYHDSHTFVFASEIKQLLCFTFIRPVLNNHIAYDFLAYSGLDYCQETFFETVQRLPPGHNLSLSLSTNGLKFDKYYQPTFAINEKIKPAEAAETFHHLLMDSVRLHLRSDVEVGSCLSGGIDSSSLVGLMHQLLSKKDRHDLQRTFSSHFEEKEANELEYMRSVIDETKVKALFTFPKPEDLLEDIRRLVWHQDEPFGSTSIFAQWSVFKLVRENGVKVMLDGQGADEQLAGYIGFTSYFLSELLAKREYWRLLREMLLHIMFQPEVWHASMPGRFGAWIRKTKSKNEIPPALSWVRPEAIEKYDGESPYLLTFSAKPFGELEHLNNALFQLTFVTNLQQLLRYEDRNSMAFSVESRVPFLDYRLVDFVFTLPSRIKIRNGYTKRCLRDAMAGIIPEKVRWRTTKLGFATPEKAWQKTILRGLLEEALSDERLLEFLTPELAHEYQRRVEKSGSADWACWRWINLHLWMKAYGVA